MNIVFRVDASEKIGFGHLSRCLTLASVLKKNNTSVCFILSRINDNLYEKITSYGFLCFQINQTNKETKKSIDFCWEKDSVETIHLIKSKEIDLLVVDHYDIDEKWHDAIRPYVNKILVIDDLANRKYDCDFLLDQTYGRENKDYNGLINNNCKLFLGSQYALLANNFNELRLQACKKRSKNKGIANILLSLGGSDTFFTEKILGGLINISWEKDITINVVLGPCATELDKIKNIIATSNYNIHLIHNAKNMAELMLDADLSVGAAGSTAWERCVLGLPTIAIAIAENQKDILKNLEADGVHRVLNIDLMKNSTIAISQAIKNAVQDIENSDMMSQKAFSICDGLGAKKVAHKLSPYFSKKGKEIIFKEAALEHVDIIYQWQSHPSTRKYAINPKTPSYEEHCQWMKSTLSSIVDYFWVIYHGAMPAGAVRLEPKSINAIDGYLISIYVAPEQYKKGIAKAALQIVKDFLPDHLIYAKVLKENKASIHLFESSGFLYNAASDFYEWSN